MEKIDKKVLVIGAAGMAGHVICSMLSQNGIKVDTLARNNVEATFSMDLNDMICSHSSMNLDRYDYVINAAGILNRSQNPQAYDSIFVNAYFPHFLKKISSQYAFKVIHLSTDCVFSGKEGAYTEESYHDGTDLYAKSKSLGELDDEQSLTIRTSIIGPELKDGIGLFHWFMKQQGVINGYSKAFWSGVTTIELAKFISDIVVNRLQINGVFHYTNSEPISKFDLLKLFNEIFRDNSLEVLSNDNYSVNKSLINTRNSEYELKKSYSEMISEMKDWFDLYKNRLYQHYDNSK